MTHPPQASSNPSRGLRRRGLGSGAAARLDFGALFCGAMAALTLTLLVWGLSVALARAGGEPERLAALLAEASLLSCGAFLLSTPLGIGIVLALEERTGRGGAGLGKSRFAQRLLAPRTCRFVAAAVAVFTVGLALGWELAIGDRAAPQRFGGVRLRNVLILSAAVLPQAMLAAKHGLGMAPSSLREDSLALGATPWQTLWMQVLPAVWGRIALRLLSDAAPLAALGAVACAAWQPPERSLPAGAVATTPATATATATAGAAVLLLIAILLTALACGAAFRPPAHPEAARARRA